METMSAVGGISSVMTPLILRSQSDSQHHCATYWTQTEDTTEQVLRSFCLLVTVLIAELANSISQWIHQSCPVLHCDNLQSRVKLQDYHN